MPHEDKGRRCFFFTGTDEFRDRFKNNEPVLHFEEQMIEVRRESILRKLNISKIRKEAVGPSPVEDNPAPEQMSFLPGLNCCIAEVQKRELKSLIPQAEPSLAFDGPNLIDFKKRVYTRNKRKKPAERVSEMATGDDEENVGMRGRGRGRGRGKGRGKKQ